MQDIWRGGEGGQERKCPFKLLLDTRKLGCVYYTIYTTFPVSIENISTFSYVTFFCNKYFHKNDDVIYKVRNFLVRGKKCDRNSLSHAAQFSVINGRFIAGRIFHESSTISFNISTWLSIKSLYKVNLFWWEFLMEILSLICLILFNAYPEVIL